MKRLSRREQILIGLGAVVMLVIGLPALWNAVAHHGPSPANSAARLRAARRERQTNLAALTRLQQQLNSVAKRQPATALPPQVMEALDRRARIDGIQLQEVRPLPPQPLDGITGVPLQLSFTAPFPQAARFLTRLRVAPSGLAVDRVVIAAVSAASDQVNVQARLSAFSIAPQNQEKSRG
jgi:Tfp pilus assembly protein PilO